MSVSNVRALIYKNVLSMWRDVILMMYFFGQCAAAVTAFYCAFGGNPSDLPLAVVNHDVTSPSPTCQNLTPFGGCEFADLSCRYLSHINGPVLKKEFYNSTEAAQRVVGRGKAWGIVHFAENFSHSYERRLRGGFIADDELLDQGSIHAMIDMSNHVISWAVKEELYSKYQDFAHQMMTACNMNPRLGDFPIRVFEPVYGTMKVNFLYTATPGMLISLSAFLGITISVWTVVHERREGLLIRNIISGVNMFEIMLAYFLCMFVMICVLAGFIVVSAFVIYRFYNVGDLILITVFLVSEGVCGILYGFAISSFCHNDGSASHASVGSLYPLIVLSGVFWPVEALNTYLYRLSTVLPLTLPVKAMRCIMVRGWTMKDFEVQLGFLTIFAWNAVFLVICVLAFRFKKF